MSDAVVIAWIGVIGAAITGVVSVIVLVLVAYTVGKVKDVANVQASTHALVNGMSHELIAAKTGEAAAGAFTKGEQAQRDRDTLPIGTAAVVVQQNGEPHP